MPVNIMLSAQENILNYYLKLDPEATENLSRLSGKVVKIEWEPLHYYWLFESDAINLTKDYKGPVDLILRGSTIDFMRMAVMKKDTALTAIPLRVSGDMEFAKQFKEFFANINVDWEEQLARFFGDTIAYPMSHFLKIMSNWAKQSIESLGQNLTNYVQTERNWLVSRDELAIFLADIDDLRDDTERFQARLAILQKELV